MKWLRRLFTREDRIAIDGGGRWSADLSAFVKAEAERIAPSVASFPPRYLERTVGMREIAADHGGAKIRFLHHSLGVTVEIVDGATRIGARTSHANLIELLKPFAGDAA